MKHDQILSVPPRPTPYAVLGSPVAHSLSPIMQQAAFDHVGIDARYYRIDVAEEKMADAMGHLKAVGFGGWNCTVPLKVRMYECCDHHSASAKQMGAVNVVVNEKGLLTGHNTDGLGWSRALFEAFGCRPGEVRILLLGAGGAARAVATQALLEGCPRLIMANRTAGRARALADQLTAHFTPSGGAEPERISVVAGEDLASALREVDLVVNTASSGLDSTAPPILSASMLRAPLLVFDAVYGAGSAKLQHEVQQAGARWADGLGMLLHQGAAAFTLWTGREAPVEVMREALAGAFSASRR